MFFTHSHSSQEILSLHCISCLDRQIIKGRVYEFSIFSFLYLIQWFKTGTCWWNDVFKIRWKDCLYSFVCLEFCCLSCLVWVIESSGVEILQVLILQCLAYIGKRASQPDSLCDHPWSSLQFTLHVALGQVLVSLYYLLLHNHLFQGSHRLTLVI